MIRTAVTVSLVPEAQGGPFVFWDGLEDAFEQAAAIGFDAVEIFAPGPDAVDRDQLKALVENTGRAVAAVGTGAGAVKHGLTLTDPDPDRRQQAIEFVASMIEFGAEFNAPAIIGSMQGRWGGDVSRPTALAWLAEALERLGAYAADREVTLIYEPLNRYETNLFNTLADGVRVLEDLETDNVRLLADLFHMNIEEVDLGQALRQAASHVNHIHFVDSNRRAVGLGHTNMQPVVEAIRDINFDGYLSIEAFALPDSQTAAKQSMDSIKALLGAELSTS